MKILLETNSCSDLGTLVSSPEKTLLCCGAKERMDYLRLQASKFNEKVAFLHDKTHYLSQEKLGFWLSKIDDLTHEEALSGVSKKQTLVHENLMNFLVKLMIWGENTIEGLRHEIGLFGEEWVFWDFICGDGAFWKNTLAKAKKASVIIAPHQFLTSEEMQNLDFDRIIIEDALLLEDHLTRLLTQRFSLFRFNAGFEFLKSFKTPVQPAPAPTPVPVPTPASTPALVHENLMKCESSLQILFGFLGMYFQNNTDILKTNDIVFDEHFKNTKEGIKVIESAKNLFETLKSIHPVNENLMNFKQHMEDFCSLFALEKYAENPTWLSMYIDSVEVINAPLSIAENLKNLWGQARDITISDFALSLNNDFSFIKTILGIPENFETKKDSDSSLKTIDFEIPENIPEPNTEGYFKETINIIEDAIKNYKENLVVIFHTKKGLAAVYENLLPKIDEKNQLLAEGKTGGLAKTIELFIKSPACPPLRVSKILFATSAVSNYLEKIAPVAKCIIFQKLPFEFSYNPLVSGRAKRYKDGFKEYTLPKTLLRFKHFLLKWDKLAGKKKLILLDSRLKNRDYGKAFLNEMGC